MTQIVYKLLHKPTGLYLDPRGRTCNASVLGKVYTGNKPPRQSFWGVTGELRGKFEDNYHTTPLDEWEVKEFVLVEKTDE